MTEQDGESAQSAARSTQEDRARADEMERTLARTTAWVIPSATVFGSLVVMILFGIGPSILVLASGALVGVIALLWASIRTLGGDAPLPEGLVAAGAARHDVSNAEERKQRMLRALKDLEHEHSIGKIDDPDFQLLSMRYREQAKAILRELDFQIEPMRAKAEEIARAHLAKKGLGKDGKDAKPEADEDDASDAPIVAKSDAARLACPKCETSNEPDAAFCKKCGTRLGAEASDAKA